MKKINNYNIYKLFLICCCVLEVVFTCLLIYIGDWLINEKTQIIILIGMIISFYLAHKIIYFD